MTNSRLFKCDVLNAGGDLGESNPRSRGNLGTGLQDAAPGNSRTGSALCATASGFIFLSYVVLFIVLMAMWLCAAQPLPVPLPGNAPPLIHSNLPPANLTLVWSDPNPPGFVGSFNIYYGPMSRTYSQVINVPSTNATILRPAGAQFMAVTAVGTNGLESGFSNEIEININVITVFIRTATNLAGPWAAEPHWADFSITNPAGNQYWDLDIKQTEQ